MPSDHGEGRLTGFDRLASAVSRFTSRAWFFSFCLLLVLLWGPSFFLFPSIDTWQLVINTVTTIVTFLLVALLQNTQKRSDDAVQQKLNAIADGLADLMQYLSEQPPADPTTLRRDREELQSAVGLEDRSGA
jgi:hypothetical protein